MAIPPHYSPYTKAGVLIFTSGQLPILDRATKSKPEGIEAQTLLVLNKVESLLKEEGLDKTAIVKTTAYITNGDDWGKVNEVYAKFFGDHKPARTIIPVSTLHYECLIELEAIASKG